MNIIIFKLVNWELRRERELISNVLLIQDRKRNESSILRLRREKKLDISSLEIFWNWDSCQWLTVNCTACSISDPAWIIQIQSIIRYWEDEEKPAWEFLSSRSPWKCFHLVNRAQSKWRCFRKVRSRGQKGQIFVPKKVTYLF